MQAFDAMIALLPKSGNFMVVWEEREVEAEAHRTA